MEHLLWQQGVLRGGVWGCVESKVCGCVDSKVCWERVFEGVLRARCVGVLTARCVDSKVCWERVLRGSMGVLRGCVWGCWEGVFERVWLRLWWLKGRWVKGCVENNGLRVWVQRKMGWHGTPRLLLTNSVDVNTPSNITRWYNRSTAPCVTLLMIMDG